MTGVHPLRRVREINDRAEWMRTRRAYVGASEVAALFGLCPHRTPLEMYVERINDLDVEETDAGRRGQWLESAAITALQDEHPEMNVVAGRQYATLDAYRIGATPDAYDAQGCPVQCKAPTAATADEWHDGPPLRYRLQALTEAMVLDRPCATLAALFVDAYDATLRLYPVERHEKAEARILRAVERFWRQIDERTPPPATFGRDARSLASLYPQNSAEPIDWTGDNRMTALVVERCALAAERSNLDRQIKEIDDELRAAIGPASGAFLPGHAVTWKASDRTAFRVPAATIRTLRVTEIKR